jgi:hypothetical protein
MRLASIILKIPAILLGTVPFGLIGLFFLCGGPGSMVSSLNLIGVPFLLFACFWALPNRILLNWRVGKGISIICYGIPIILAWGFFTYIRGTTGAKSISSFDLIAFGVIVAGIACGALSYFLARKVSSGTSEKEKGKGQLDNIRAGE